jgi:lipopolysaccharide biosynthesis glycosyltransferase
MELDKKIACCSTLNDLYFEGFLTFFESLKTHNPKFNLPYYIFAWGDLSSKNIEYLHNLYTNFEIKNIDNTKYDGVKYSTRFRDWNINCVNRFEILSLSDYDRVIFFDVDMLIIKNLDELFQFDGDFCACEEPKDILIDHPAVFNQSLKTFNGGLMLFSKKYLNKETQDGLISIALQKKWSSDEPILNTFFTNDKVTFLPDTYLVTMHGITEKTFSSAKILHFVGEKKPWNKGGLPDKYDRNCVRGLVDKTLLFKVDLKYRQYYNKAIKKFNEYKENSCNCTSR